MTAAPTPSVCWICSNEVCLGWGCDAGGMPVLSPAELLALDLPRLCISCESRPAEVGDGSNFCEVCNPAAKYVPAPSLRELSEGEMRDQRDFEHDHGWGFDFNRHGDTIWRG